MQSFFTLTIYIYSYSFTAPGTYSPEKCVFLNDSVGFSFGIKPQQKIEITTPAPNQYEPEKSMKLLDYQPAFSLSGRPKEGKLSQTPGTIECSRFGNAGMQLYFTES